MKPIRILQVVTIMNRGGLETMLMNYYREINRKDVQFDFMVHRTEEGHYDKEILELGGRIYHMPQIKPGNYRLYFKLLEKFFNEHKEYKVVHSHINENSSFVLRAANKAGIPCRIAHSHLSDLGIDLKLPFRLYARFFMKNNPTNYFACSEKAGQWLFGNKIVNSKKLKVLNNAVNVSDFKYNEKIRNKVRNELGIGNELVIGHIGRFNKQKNHEFLIDIFNNVLQKRSDVTLLLVGDGDLRHSVEKKIENLGLSSHVKVLGVRTDISNLMQAMDIFLFPSLFEGLPVVLVEAQAAGLKCIVSNAITMESNITGRLDFISLDKSPDYWTQQILSSTYEHVDTSESFKTNGYDSTTMAEWLANYYRENYILEAK